MTWGLTVVIPCGAVKRATRCQAKSMYVGSMFRASWRAAANLAGQRGRIFILSAKHGLLVPEWEIDPYEQRIDRPGCVRAVTVAEQVTRLNIQGTVVTLLPKRYLKLLSDALSGFDGQMVDLLQGTRGMGYQRQVLRKICEQGFDRPLPLRL